MNIIFFSKDFSFVGGAEKVSKILAEKFSKSGHNVYLVSLYEERPLELPPGVKYRRLFDSKVTLTKNLLSILCKVRGVMKEIKPDIWIDTGHGNSFISIVSRLRLKFSIIFHSHSTILDATNLLQRLSLYLLHWSNNCKIVTISKKEYELYLKRFNGDKVCLIHNPIIVQSKNKSFIENDVMRFICVASNYYAKGVDRLLDIFSEVIKLNIKNGIRLVVVGNVVLDTEFLEHVRRLNLGSYIDYIPHTDSIEEEYLKCDALLMTSRKEVFPMAILEALSNGLPVIAYDCHSGPDEIIQNNINGFVIKEGDKEEFIRSLYSIINDKIRFNQMAGAAKNSVCRFDLSHINKRWNELILVDL
ncbi:glycosyltransferase [Vibrio owensii]|uniref:glycosyltransferase n=1 Tax=Vibrio owensii TaxID=696485 RepID=UPI003D9FBDF4